MRFVIGAIALTAVFAIGCGGDDDDNDPTATNTRGAGSTATQPAEATTAAAGSTNTPAPGQTGTPVPVVFEPTFTCDSPVGVLEVRTLDGEEVEFSERVFDIVERNGNLVLHVGAPATAVLRVEVAIWPAAIDDFDGPPAQGFADRIICARGTVENIGGVRTIQVQSADQITVVAD